MKLDQSHLRCSNSKTADIHGLAPVAKTTRRSAAKRESLARFARGAVLVLAIAGACFAVGCNKKFKAPASARLVGGGESIRFEAPSNGTLFIVDDRQLLASQTLKKGEVFEAKGQIASPAGGNRALSFETRIYFEPEDSSQLIEIDQWSEKPKDR